MGIRSGYMLALLIMILERTVSLAWLKIAVGAAWFASCCCVHTLLLPFNRRCYRIED